MPLIYTYMRLHVRCLVIYTIEGIDNAVRCNSEEQGRRSSCCIVVHRVPISRDDLACSASPSHQHVQLPEAVFMNLICCSPPRPLYIRVCVQLHLCDLLYDLLTLLLSLHHSSQSPHICS